MMSNFKNLVTVALLAIMLSACSGKKYRGMSDGVKNEVRSTEVVYLEPYRQLHGDIENSHISAYTGGGLLFGLVEGVIDSNRQSHADEQIDRLEKIFVRFNPQKNFEEDMLRVLASHTWLGDIKIIRKKEQKNEKIKRSIASIVDQSKYDTVMVLNINYIFNPEFTSLSGILDISIYAGNAKFRNTAKIKNSYDEPVYRNKIISTYELKNKATNIADNTTVWMMVDGAEFYSALSHINSSLKTKIDWSLKNTSIVLDE